MGRKVLDVIFRPHRTLRQAASAGTLGPAVLGMMILALTWSGFCLWLYRDGHQPSFAGWSISARDYYLWQAFFLPPLFLVLWALYAVFADRLARWSGAESALRRAASVLGLTYGPPVLCAYVLPDLLAYAIWGFESLARVARIAAPVAMLWVVSLSAYGLAQVYRLSMRRSVAVALLAFLGQAVFAAMLIR